jgi:hypothetical protein
MNGLELINIDLAIAFGRVAVILDKCGASGDALRDPDAGIETEQYETGGSKDAKCYHEIGRFPDKFSLPGRSDVLALLSPHEY